MSELSAQELNEQLKATAAVYNTQNPAGETEEEAAARAAAAQFEQTQGSKTHSGETEVRADTPEEIAAAEAAKAEEEAKATAEEEAKKAEKEKAETPEETEEEKARREATEAETQKEIDDAEWMTTDSKEFNASINLMKAAGMTPAEAGAIFDDAAQTGDLSKVDHAALVEKVGEDQASLIMAGFTKYVESEGQALLERVNKVHDSVGGSENWQKMTQWARGKAKGDTEFRGKVEGITEMMNSGGILQAELAAKELMSMYNADKGNSTITPTAKAVDVTGKPAAKPASTATPTSAREYAEAVEYAQRNLRGSDQRAAIAKAKADREAGRAKGL